MNRCPITYEDCGSARYSDRGLALLSQRLDRLEEFPYSAAEQRREAHLRAGKMSIQGVQPKLSARLSAARSVFEIVDSSGRYILKPQHPDFPSVPENEDLVMKMASVAGIQTPVHGLMHCSDGTLTYFIRRFDRKRQKDKIPVQDFATLADRDRDTKYRWSVEKLFDLLEFCTFPVVESVEMLRRLLFCFLVGNEDMHLKNWAVVSPGRRVTLAPAYDLLSFVAMYEFIGRPAGDIEESSLPLAGKKKHLARSHWIDYLARQRLSLTEDVIAKMLGGFTAAFPEWDSLIRRSFLPRQMQDILSGVISRRRAALGI